MTIGDARALGAGLIGRVRKLPLVVLLVAATVALALLVAAAVGLSGPRYAVLFYGLTPSRGGQVIAALQKDGIPYRLSQNGNVIAVPVSDLGKARLEMGAQGEPGGSASSGWKALENASMTTSEAATRALHLQATEQSLEATITTLSGAKKVQVLLAVPKDTPFLADQPKPKASVVLTRVPEADASLGMAVAQVVAGAVSGLDKRDVVVATSQGEVIFPANRNQSISQEIAIEDRIEAAQEAKIRRLLAPILGAGNFRIAVSADVAFATKTIHSTSYGPKSYPVSVDTQSDKKVGNNNVPMGIPGALSNQPPGATSTPLNRPKSSGSATGAAGGTGKRKRPHPVVPSSTSKKSHTRFAIDQTSATTVPAAWTVQKVNASLIVNKSALGQLNVSALQSMVAATIVEPTGSVRVTTAAFVSPGTVPLAPPQPRTTRIMQAALLVLAALAMLFGAILPVIRWLRGMVARGGITRIAPDLAEAEVRPDAMAASLHQITGQVAEVGQTRPEAMARVLQKWVQTGRPE